MPRAERFAVLGLLVGMALSAVTLVLLSRDLSFWADELDWLTFGEGFSPETLLTPHNSHLIGVPRVIYEGFPRLFGADYLPFRLVSIAAVLACAALFFVLARRRIGGPLALVPALVLLFFGSSSEVVVSPLGLPISLSVAFGLAAFVALERESRAADVVAAAFLALAILSDTFGVIMAGGAVLYLGLDPQRRRRLWVAVVPLVLYAAWWAWARQFDQDIASASNLGGVPAFVVESAAATIGAITGAGKSLGSSSDGVETVVGIVCGAIAVAGAVLLIARARRHGASAALWAFALTLLVFWISAGLSEGDGREPSTPRYMLFAAIMVFLILAESFRGERISERTRTAVLIVLVVCFAGNVVRLVDNSAGLTDRAATVQTQLAMIELAGGEANPEFRPSIEGPPASSDIVASAVQLNAFADRHGSLGFSLDEVAEQPEGERRAGDFVLVQAARALAVPAGGDVTVAAESCTNEGSGLELPSGISLLRLEDDADGGPLLLGRFGSEPSVVAGELEPGVHAVINLPAAGDEPWSATVPGPVEVCPLGDPAF